MTDKKSNDSRRKLLKSIAAGSGAVVAGKSLPESWTKPIVDSVMLPAHAETTNDNASAAVLTNKSFYTAPTYTDGSLQEPSNPLFDALIPTAMAGTDAPLGMLITLSEVGGKVIAESEHFDRNQTARFIGENISTDDGAPATDLRRVGCRPGSHDDIRIVGYTFNASSVTVNITTSNNDTIIQTVQLGTGTLTETCER